MNTFFKKNLLCFSLILCCLLNSFGQETEMQFNTTAKYHEALTLYNNKAYAASQQLFVKVSNFAVEKQSLKANADYYDAICAIKLNQTNADKKVLDFVENHPNSNKKQLAYLNVGNYYFANRKAAHSLKWYTKVDEKLLNTEDKSDLNFKMGYALLVSGYVDDAKTRFEKLLSNVRYGDDARYYYGYIAYKQEDYDLAETSLTEIADVATYKNKANYYLLDISFKAGRFEKSIEIGKKILPNADKKQQSDINKIIGESYFNLEKYAEAIPYLQNYKGKKGRWNNTDYYQLGFAHFKQNDYENAVRNFNKIIDQKNKVSQNAYYQLAECYLKLDKKPEALNAFKSASEMEFDKKVKEDAFLNYAKLSYEEGNPYQSVPEVLQAYLNTYPNSPQTNEINELLITSFLHQQDYQGALDYIEKNKKFKNDALKNEVSLYRGIQLFNEDKLQKSLSFLENGTQSNDLELQNKALFWLAESNYRLGNFQKALSLFLKVDSSETTENNLLSYNIGYCYFKLKEYQKSAHYFNQYTTQKNNEIELKDDAFLRLGDSYYASKEYNKAIVSYDKIIEDSGIGADYAQYQKAMSNGLSGNYQQKITDLLAVVNTKTNSKFKDDALFQLGTTYTTIRENNKAQDAYNRLLKNHPKSAYNPNVLLRQGLLFYNTNEDKKALSKFKEIVAKYPNSNEAKQAVTNARNVYIDIGKVDEYAVWVKDISFINVTDADLDNASYEAAENKFLENNTKKAIEGFDKYLQNFPNGLHALKSHFYLAQSYLKNNQTEKSIPHYTYVTSQSQSEFSEESLSKLSQIYLEKEDWFNAMSLLERLEVEANYPQNTIFAQSNLMKGYYEAEDYKKAVEYAEKVLTTNKIEKTIEADAKIIIARSAFKTGDFTTSEEFFIEVGRTATGELKAETLYYDAFFKHENKEYEPSTKIVQKLISDYSAYKYWGVKSYVIMAKNYYALEDAYQATYILENIIKNFTQYEDIIEEATSELRTIKNNEAKTNESVTPQK